MSAGVLPLVDLRGGMPRRIVDGLLGIVVVVYVDCPSILRPCSSCVVEGDSSRTSSDRLRLGWMIRLVGYSSCNPPTINLPRIGFRVAIVSIMTHLRYRCARISVGLRLLDMLDIGGVGASGFRRIGPVNRVRYHVVPHLRYRIRIRSLPRSMASVPTHFCVVVVRIISVRDVGLCYPSRGRTDTVVVLLGRYG